MDLQPNNLAERGVLALLSRRRTASLPSLADELGIPASTVVKVLSRLVGRELVQRQESRSSGRGRPSYTYGMRLPHPTLAMWVDSTQLAAAIVGEDLSLLAEHTVQIAHIASADAAAAWAREAFYALTSQANINPASIKSAALSINALVTDGKIHSSSVLGWKQANIRQLLSDALRLEVGLVASPYLLAEYALLPAIAPELLVCFNVGDGISAHGISAGHQVRGATDRAGELGHISMTSEGPLCGCGHRGCLEAICSGPAIVKRVRALRNDKTAPAWLKEIAGLSPRAVIEQLYRAWCDGDKTARALMDEVLDQLAWGLGLTFNMLDPDQVICTGYVLKDREAWIEQIVRRSRRWILHGTDRELAVISGRASVRDYLQVIASQLHIDQQRLEK